jgi:hypothetical protein
MMKTFKATRIAVVACAIASVSSNYNSTLALQLRVLPTKNYNYKTGPKPSVPDAAEIEEGRKQVQLDLKQRNELRK